MPRLFIAVMTITLIATGPAIAQEVASRDKPDPPLIALRVDSGTPCGKIEIHLPEGARFGWSQHGAGFGIPYDLPGKHTPRSYSMGLRCYEKHVAEVQSGYVLYNERTAHLELSPELWADYEKAPVEKRTEAEQHFRKASEVFHLKAVNSEGWLFVMNLNSIDDDSGMKAVNFCLFKRESDHALCGFSALTYFFNDPDAANLPTIRRYIESIRFIPDTAPSSNASDNGD